MADFEFDTAAARADGVPDTQIAEFLAARRGFDLAAARRDGVSDTTIVDFLAPVKEAPPTPEVTPPKKKATIGDDINRGWQRAIETVQTLRADMSAQRLSDIEAAKKKADAGEYLTPWEKKQVADYDKVSGEVKGELAERLSSAAARREKADQIPMSPGYKAFKEAEGVGGKLEALWRSPADVVTSIIAEGAVATAPSLGAAVIGGIGPGAVVAGGTSYMQAYAEKVVDLLAKRGVDIKDKGAVMAALSDPETAKDIRTDATLAAIPQAAAGAASMAVAPLTMAPASLATKPIRQQAVNIPAQAVTQGALAGAGEAGSQAAIGEKIDSGKIAEAFISGAAQGPVDVAAFAAHRAIGGRTPEQVAKPVLEAPDTDTAIRAAEAQVNMRPVDVTAVERQAAEYGIQADIDQASALRLFAGLNEGEIQQDQGGNYFYAKDGAEPVPLKIWDVNAPRKEGDGLVSPELVAAQRDAYEQLGMRVVYLENEGGKVADFDGAVMPGQDVIFLSNDLSRNAAQVGSHEVAHALEDVRLPDGTTAADTFHNLIRDGLTDTGWREAIDLFGKNAPDRAAFPADEDGAAAHADALERFMFREIGAELGGEAPKFNSWMPRLADAIEQRWGPQVAKDALAKLIDNVRQAMTRMREFFFRPNEEFQPDLVGHRWVTNLEQFHDTLAQAYAQRYGDQAGFRDRGPAPPEPQRALPAPSLVTPPPVTVTPENVFRPETYGAPRDTILQRPTQTFQDRLADETERSWDYKADMGRVQRGIPRNENFARDQARERIMRQDAARDVQFAIENGIPEDRIPEIARMYRPQEGETPTQAFDRAMDRWMTQREAEGALIDSDVEAYDTLKMMGPPDPVLAEAFQRLEEMYTGRERERPGDENIPLGDTEANRPTARASQEPAASAGRPESTEGGGRPGDSRPAAGEASPVAAREPAPAAPPVAPKPQEPSAPAARGDGWTQIGRNAEGKMLYEDARGVRSYLERGIRVSEPVGIKPGSNEISVNRTRSEYQLASEQPAATPKAEPASSGVAEPKSAAANPKGVSPDRRVANAMSLMLADGKMKVSSGDLQRLADRTYGGTLSEGKYSRDQLYDAIELGVNRYIQQHPERFNPAVDATQAKATAADLAALKDRLPTQTVRAGEKDAYQQFSTPPDYAYAANWVANLKPDDHVLEPSAGVGGLLVHAMNAGVRETTGNELSAKRRDMLEALEPTRVTGEDAAQLHNILPSDVRPTVVVMNPPFSRAAERMGGKMVLDEGAKHIEQALSRLEPGGRLVAIVGDGMKPAGTVTPGYSRDRGRGGGEGFRDWWNKIGAVYDVRANVGVDRSIYTKYGTAFPTRLLVIDKNPPSGRPIVTGDARDAAQIIDRLQEVRDERTAIQSTAGEPSRPEVAAERGPGAELPDAARGVGAGSRGGSAAPAGAEPAGPAGRGADGQSPAGNVGGAVDQVAPVQRQPVDRGAGGEPRAATEPSGEPAGRGGDRAGDGVRQDGSGERSEPGVTPAPEEVLAIEDAVSKPGPTDDQPISEAVYEKYRPQRIQVAGAKAHPGALVQSAAMASVLPPKTDYKPRIPSALVKTGGLSDAQLEAITYAGHAHSDVMPNGKRRGFFIGDGTGVGKGREIAGILLDNKQQGRTRAIWVSEKRQLINDAKRDWSGLMQPATEIIDHGKVKPGDPLKGDKGILFTTYDTLKSAEQTKVEGEKVKGKSRIDQIVDWLGKDFDGVIAFDEAHNLGNATDEKGSRGVKKASQKALAGVELQNKLPNARVVYVSATGATEVTNLAYADRLGLWGEGTPFPNRQDFVSKVQSGGMAAMELVARDMKALGHYIARNLSYDGVQYQRVEHKLSSEQRATYDKMAEGWQTVLQNFEKALELTGATEDGKTTNGRAKAAAMSAFWGAHQRFFNQIITSMQMPSVLRSVEADLKAGRQAVLQLVNTMEAAQERALEKARAAGDDLENLDMTPRDQLMQLVEKSFPVQQMEEYSDDGGNIRTRPAKDSKGNPVVNREAVALRDRLLDELGSLRVPDGPLEILLNHFGTDKVAEVTGRGQRVVRKVDDESGQMKSVVEKRGAQSSVAETNDFQAGKKSILIFSEAGGTGRSYHAALGSGSENARRSHYLVQGGWRADKAVQGFGRTHRTSQASAPIFNLVTTDLEGQKRFISSIARRLGQLGALTKGERRTGDQGMFGMRDNLESTEARDALRQFFFDVERGQAEGITMTDLERGMGLKMRDPETGQLAKELPEMSQFLNRILSLKIEDQNRVFQAFSNRLDGVIERAAAAGKLDVGVETYKADRISKASDQVVYTDPRSGAETKHVRLTVENRNHPVSFDDTLAGKNKTNGKKPDQFYVNEASGNVFAATEAGTRTLDDGRVVDQVRLTSPLDYQFIEKYELSSRVSSNWRKVDEAEARTLWDQKVASIPEFRKSNLDVITGAVLPIWDRLGGNPKIYRLQTEDGERLLGRVIPATQVDATLKRLGAEGTKVTETPAEIAGRVLGGATAELANEWKIKSSRVAGERRLEIVGPNFTHNEELSRHGVFSERIDYKTRYFIPTEPAAAAAAIEAITRNRPVTSLDSGAAFSPRVDPRANPNRSYTPEQQAMLERQRGGEVPGGIREWWNETKQNLATKVAVETVDRYAGLRKKMPDAYVGSRIANSSEGAKVVFLTEGTLRFNGKAYDFKERNGGARDLFRPLKEDVGDFLMWVASNRAEGLKGEGRERRFSDEDIAAGKTLNQGDLAFDYVLPNGNTTRSREVAYVDSLRKLNALNNNVRDLLVESGMVKRETADEWMKNDFYVPFFREEPNGRREFTGPLQSSGMTKQKGPQALKGGTEQVRDLAQNLFTNWTHIIDAAQKNRSASSTLNATESVGAAEKITTKQYDAMSDREKKQTTWVMEDGERQYYVVHDPLVQKAVSVLDPLYDPLKILSAARTAKQVLQVGVTRNPLFAARNISRDSIQVLATTPQSMNVPNNIARGMAAGDLKGALANMGRAFLLGEDLKPLNLSDEAVSALAGGGLMRIAAFSDSGVEGMKLGNILDTPRKLDTVLRKFENAWDAYGEVISKGEEANRLALYSKLRGEGVDHDIASFSAQDVTDFGLSGANTIVRYIRETVPFTNSRLQGLYKVGRALKGTDRAMFRALGADAAAPSAKNAAAVTVLRTAGVIGTLAVATLALDAIYADDPEYQNRDEYDRNNYWFFKIGESRFRIPMPFEVGALARIAANTAEAFFDDKMSVDRYFKNIWSMMKDNLGFDVIPQVVAPLEDLRTNTSWTGRPIEPRGLERLRPEDRYTGNTSLAARGVSSAINSAMRAVPGLGGAQGPSPIQVDYLVQAYGGWLASTILGTADTAVRTFSSEPERPDRDGWAQWTQGLISTEPRSTSRYVEELYRQAKTVEQAFATYRDMIQQGRAKEAQDFFVENQDLIRRHGLVGAVTRLEGDLNRQIRLISNSDQMTGAQKKVLINQLTAQKAKAAEQAMGALR